MLTEPVADIRIFGRLGSLRVMCRSLLLLTANNASLRRDMLRRTLPLRIVVPEEKPELRKFDFDPVTEATADRRELLTAAFTVALAWWKVRDLPENKGFRKPLGSFEQWADLVAGAVAWLTGTNPIDLIEERSEQDQGATGERALVAELHRVMGAGEWKAGDAAGKVDPQSWGEVVRFKGEHPTGREVGGWLRDRRDRVFGSYVLRCRHDTTANASMWRVGTLPGHTDIPDIIPSLTRDLAENAKSQERGGDTSGMSRMSGTPPPPPAWDNHPAWLRKVGASQAGGAPEVVAWAKAAGGTSAHGRDGQLRVILPDLPEGPSLSALRQAAATRGVELASATGAGGRA
jgi:hypothetical protein